MATSLEIEYSPEGIRTIREKRFSVHKQSREVAREWANTIAKEVLQRRALQDHSRGRYEAAERVSRRFQQLRDQWQNETGHLSVTFKRAMHPAYQQMIGMGRAALPFIFNELRERPSGQWFWALNAITGEHATLNQTSIDRAIEAWLDWGTQHGYIL